MTRVYTRLIAAFLSGIVCLEASSALAVEDGDKAPAPTGAPHFCEKHYPQGALDKEIEGRVGLSVAITSEGNIVDPVVTESSGNAELDQAAVACVLGWKFKPAQRDDKPVAVRGTLHVNWRLPYIPIVQHRGCFKLYGVTSQQQPNTGATVVAFRIDGGQVKEASVVVTSGNAELDRNAIACAESWRYAATNSDGTTTSRHMKEIILWGPGPSKVPGNDHACLPELWAAAAGGTGTTHVAFTIAEDGSVKNPYIWTSSGNMYLDGASLACVSRWRYTPVIVSDKPVEIPWDAIIEYKIDGHQ